MKQTVRQLILTLFLSLGLLPFSSLSTEAAYGDLLWMGTTGDVIYGAPAISDDGRIVVGSEDGNLYCFTPDGSIDWVFTGAGDWIDSSPTIGSNGTVYVGSWDHHLYAVSLEDGSLKWKYETGGFIIGSPAIGPEGTIFAGSTDGFLYALNPDGSLRWFSSTLANFAPISGSPVVNASGNTVYFGNEAGEFTAVDAATGAGKWTFLVEESSSDASVSTAITGTAAIGEDGSLYFGSENGSFHALSPTGQLRWSYKAAEPIRSSPAISTDGTVYFAAQDGYLYALDTEGLQLWETFVGDVFYCSPAIDSSGNILIAGYAGSATLGAATRFVSVTSNGDIIWEFVIMGYNDSSPNIAPDGSFTFGAHDGILYKFAGSAPLMNGQWPRFQANRQQDGAAYFRSGQQLIDYFPAISQTVDGWSYVPWFGLGWIYASQIPWIQHIDHGYIYLSTPKGDSIWFYDLQMKDWIYATAVAPNFYYRYSTAGWLYHLPGSRAPAGRWFYAFALGDWVIL